MEGDFLIVSVAYPEPAPDGGAQLIRVWDPTGPVRADVVLVHGLGEHTGRYARTGSLLAETGYRVRGFDLLGFGASSGERGDTPRWSLFLDQVQESLGAVRNGDRPLVLLGHSVGGLIALDYALAERPQPDLLVLSAPALGGGKPWQRALAPFLARLFPTLRLPNPVPVDQLSRDPSVGDAYLADPLVITKTSLRLGAGILTTQARALTALSKLTLPTLVMHGGADRIIPTAASLPLASLPSVERRVYPELRHEIFNEPEGPKVVKEMIEWIDAHLPPRG
jgi:alpha-beta hydrolase superfamily lysophospholipase